MATKIKQSKITGEQVTKYYQDIPRAAYYIEDQYYIGENTKILSANVKKAPDNRVPIAFVNRLVKNLLGYAARVGDITASQETLNKAEINDAVVSTFDAIQDDNHLNILNTKQYKQVLKHGVGYELTWTEINKEGKAKIFIADIPVTEGLPIWSQELSTVKKLDSFIRYYTRTTAEALKVDNEDLTLEAGYYANLYIKGGYEVWYMGPLKEQGEILETPGTTEAIFRVFIDQPFEDVQVTVFFGNDEFIPYWMPVKNIIDEYDKIISKNINESDRFNDSWLLMVQKIDPDTKKKIDEIGVLDDLQKAYQEGVTDVFPRFLERKVPVDHAKLMLDTLETLLYTIIGVPSFLDDSFNASSGVALLYRLIGLEYAAIEIDTLFDLALQQRYELIKQALKSDVKSIISFLPLFLPAGLRARITVGSTPSIISIVVSRSLISHAARPLLPGT